MYYIHRARRNTNTDLSITFQVQGELVMLFSHQKSQWKEKTYSLLTLLQKDFVGLLWF